jgi:hypothetical protein
MTALEQIYDWAHKALNGGLKRAGRQVTAADYKQVLRMIRAEAADALEKREDVNLLEAAQEILSDFNQYGEVLQQGDNGEYGTESAIGRLNTAITAAQG